MSTSWHWRIYISGPMIAIEIIAAIEVAIHHPLGLFEHRKTTACIIANATGK
jgi:hypothetical protein